MLSTSVTLLPENNQMTRAQTKANRLLQIEALLLAHPEGLAQAEIARRLDVNRSTVGRYIPDLPGHVYIDDQDGNRWKIDREGYLVNVRFNLHEALAVHLAARLLATRMDRQNPHAAAALRKLGISLEGLAPRISMHLKQSADVMDDVGLRHDPHYLQVLEKLTLAWAEERKVRVWHRHQETGRLFKYVLAPYFVEPYAVGQSVYVIGRREPPGARRTFKIARIERIELTNERYKIPDDFDPRSLLADAWGIWYTEAEPQEVVLRFNRRVVDRVRETRWHQSEQLAEERDGSLLWRAWVAEPQEMLPWIRGWGADCEVMEPPGLRDEMIGEARRLAASYGWQIHRGKTTKDEPSLAQTFRDFFGSEK
jgi:predicted DNA-binding transcriptional regulator YafY